MSIGDPFNPFDGFNGIYIPTAIVRMRHLNTRSKICYGRLMRYAGKNGHCFPSVGTLAAEIGIGKRQTQKCLSELERERLIRRLSRPGTTDLIQFLWHEAFETQDRGVNQSSPPGVNQSSQVAKHSSPQGCTGVHPKRVTHHHHEDDHSEESELQQPFGRLEEKPSQEGGNAVSLPALSGPRTVVDSAEAELIAFAQGKGQLLTRDTLQRVREFVELRGVTLERFVAAIRPQFGNKIKNPSGFLLDRARKVRAILDAAVPPTAPAKALAFEDRCEQCGGVVGGGLIRAAGGIVPCPTCARPEFITNFLEQEERRRLRALQLQSLTHTAGNSDGHS